MLSDLRMSMISCRQWRRWTAAGERESEVS
jgi:hypothetical protein